MLIWVSSTLHLDLGRTLVSSEEAVRSTQTWYKTPSLRVLNTKEQLRTNSHLTKKKIISYCIWSIMYALWHGIMSYYVLSGYQRPPPAAPPVSSAPIDPRKKRRLTVKKKKKNWKGIHDRLDELIPNQGFSHLSEHWILDHQGSVFSKIIFAHRVYYVSGSVTPELVQQ